MNKSTGNMYNWLDATWNPLNGRCPHACTYCYVKRTTAGRMGFYDGPLRLNENQMRNPLGKGKRVFVCNLNDLFAARAPWQMTANILNRCFEFPNQYIFQTKDPRRFWAFEKLLNLLACTIGTTIETNRPSVSTVPQPRDRAYWIIEAKAIKPTFITIEPIMEFDLDEFLMMLVGCRPSFINIGADSKGHHLPEPSREKVLALIAGLRGAGIEVREKDNLRRITG
jgi:DNA repair photolyase